MIFVCCNLNFEHEEGDASDILCNIMNYQIIYRYFQNPFTSFCIIEINNFRRLWDYRFT
jgi:hypothetical protein